MWWCLGDPWNPWSEGWWPTGAELGSVAHEGRVFDVRRLELGRQGELAWPKGTVRVAGAERSNSGDRINCSLKVIETVTNFADFVVPGSSEKHLTGNRGKLTYSPALPGWCLVSLPFL